MAKKQTFGEKVLKAKASHRKMAKVVISTKNSAGKYAFKEAMVDHDNVKDFLQQAKN